MRLRAFLDAVAARNFILALIIGALVGWIISLLFPSKKGASQDILLGLVGALVFSLWVTASREGIPQVYLGRVVFVEVLGAVIFIVVGRLLAGNSGGSRKKK